jgi:hypothetical protein
MAKVAQPARARDAWPGACGARPAAWWPATAWTGWCGGGGVSTSGRQGESRAKWHGRWLTVSTRRRRIEAELSRSNGFVPSSGGGASGGRRSDEEGMGVGRCCAEGKKEREKGGGDGATTFIAARWGAQEVWGGRRRPHGGREWEGPGATLGGGRRPIVA